MNWFLIFDLDLISLELNTVGRLAGSECRKIRPPLNGQFTDRPRLTDKRPMITPARDGERHFGVSTAGRFREASSRRTVCDSGRRAARFALDLPSNCAH
ncbi:hypothetical protein [Actinoplanes solisilvae]|uniref:hypothetical protein n=1 Tax=Actinoplanes solisilvae TaxID=2486853 RepID=UPI000FDAC24A|nr:hypothetical protein [Actinoplanes solisilvae]